MTLLTVVKDVCAVVGVLQPIAVFSGIANNRTMQEMVALANEMAQRIAYDLRDWTRLRKIVTPAYVGDGVTTAWDLPADFKRMLLTTQVRRSTMTTMPMRFVADTDEWLTRRYSGDDGNTYGEWTIFGGQIHLYPALAGPVLNEALEIVTPAETATFSYMHKNCVTLASGGVSDVFVADGDTFAISERLLRLGMIWQWKAQKGAPYAEDMSTYGDALSYEMGHDSPAPIIVGRYPISASANALATQTIYVP